MFSSCVLFDIRKSGTVDCGNPIPSLPVTCVKGPIRCLDQLFSPILRDHLSHNRLFYFRLNGINQPGLTEWDRICWTPDSLTTPLGDQRMCEQLYLSSYYDRFFSVLRWVNSRTLSERKLTLQAGFQLHLLYPRGDEYPLKLHLVPNGHDLQTVPSCLPANRLLHFLPPDYRGLPSLNTFFPA